MLIVLFTVDSNYSKSDLTDLTQNEVVLLLLTVIYSQSQWPRGLRRRSAAARLLRSWVRIPPGARMLVYSEFCVLLGRSLCDGLITRPEKSYRL